MIIATTLLPALLAVGPGASAVEPLGRGDRIRYVREGEGHRSGTVVDLGPDWLLVRPRNGSPPVRIPMDRLRQLEVAAGRRSLAPEGAVIGSIPGGLFGMLVGVFATACWDAAPDDAGARAPTAGGCGSGTPVALFSALGVAAGAGVGAAMGAAFKVDRWRPIKTGSITTRVSLARGGGVQAAVALSFR